VTGVRLRNLLTAEEQIFPCAGVFIAIGHKPNTDLFKGQIETDAIGYIKTSGHFNGDQYSRRVRLRRRAGFGLSPGGDGGRYRLHVCYRCERFLDHLPVAMPSGEEGNN